MCIKIKILHNICSMYSRLIISIIHGLANYHGRLLTGSDSRVRSDRSGDQLGIQILLGSKRASSACTTSHVKHLCRVFRKEYIVGAGAGNIREGEGSTERDACLGGGEPREVVDG